MSVQSSCTTSTCRAALPDVINTLRAYQIVLPQCEEVQCAVLCWQHGSIVKSSTARQLDKLTANDRPYRTGSGDLPAARPGPGLTGSSGSSGSRLGAAWSGAGDAQRCPRRSGCFRLQSLTVRGHPEEPRSWRRRRSSEQRDSPAAGSRWRKSSRRKITAPLSRCSQPCSSPCGHWGRTPAWPWLLTVVWGCRSYELWFHQIYLRVRFQPFPVQLVAECYCSIEKVTGSNPGLLCVNVSLSGTGFISNTDDWWKILWKIHCVWPHMSWQLCTHNNESLMTH